MSDSGDYFQLWYQDNPDAAETYKLRFSRREKAERWIKRLPVAERDRYFIRAAQEAPHV